MSPGKKDKIFTDSASEDQKTLISNVERYRSIDCGGAAYRRRLPFETLSRLLFLSQADEEAPSLFAVSVSTIITFLLLFQNRSYLRRATVG